MTNNTSAAIRAKRLLHEAGLNTFEAHDGTITLDAPVPYPLIVPDLPDAELRQNLANQLDEYDADNEYRQFGSMQHDPASQERMFDEFLNTKARFVQAAEILRG